MSEDTVPTRKPAARLAGIYAGLFAALALVGLACWQWPVVAERWYAYKYGKMQDAVYRGKLEKLGEKHPELLLSRWFHLVKTYKHANEFAAIPLRVRQKGLGLFLGERLKGDWWKEKSKPSALLDFPCPRRREEWEPHVRLLRDAMKRVDRPPSSRGVTIYLFYDVCWALALCGDDTGLPYLEDNLFNDAGLYPYQVDAITDCMQGPPGVVALAAHGNARAREDVLKGLQRLRRREEVAYRIEETLKAGEGYQPENLDWLRAALANDLKQRAAGQSVRFRKVVDDLLRASCAACCPSTENPLSGSRLVCHDGIVFAEDVRVESDGKWRLQREPMEKEAYLEFWKELLVFDLWNLSESEDLFGKTSSRDGMVAAYRAGEKYRLIWRGGFGVYWRWPDEPATWVGPLVRERIKSGAAVTTGRIELSAGVSNKLGGAWLRGEPWEEIVKSAR